MRKQNNSKHELDFRPIGSAMREARLSEGWTQEETAEKLGIEQQHYQRIERAGAYPGIDLFYRIIRLLRLSVDELFFPNVKPTKSGRRRRLDAMLDKLEDDELLVIIGVIKGLLQMREEKGKK